MAEVKKHLEALCCGLLWRVAQVQSGLGLEEPGLGLGQLSIPSIFKLQALVALRERSSSQEILKSNPVCAGRQLT